MDWNFLSCEQYELTPHWNNVRSELLVRKIKRQKYLKMDI